MTNLFEQLFLINHCGIVVQGVEKAMVIVFRGESVPTAVSEEICKKKLPQNCS